MKRKSLFLIVTLCMTFTLLSYYDADITESDQYRAYAENGDPISLGNDRGWNINEEGPIDVRYSAHLADDDTPCLVLNYTIGSRFILGDR